MTRDCQIVTDQLREAFQAFRVAAGLTEGVDVAASYVEEQERGAEVEVTFHLVCKLTQ